MDLTTHDDFFRPHPHFDDGINRAICQSEIEGGVNVNELAPGALLAVETQYHTYRVEYQGDGDMIISGHPRFCPDPVRVYLAGSTWGTPMIKIRYIGRGMKMEFLHPTLGVIQTSKVRDVRTIPADRPRGEQPWGFA